MTTTAATRTRRVGERLAWPVARALDDELLGLGYDELTELWEETGLPEGWSPEMAAELAQASWSVVSGQIGAMAGTRARWGNAVSALARLCASEYFDEETDELKPTPFDDLAEFGDEFRADPRCGWGTGPGALRRLYDYGQEHGAFGHVKARRAEPWQPAHADDHEPLDRAWSIALKHAPRRPKLPVQVCSIFAAPKRGLEIADVDGAVDLPSVFQLVATLLVWGPDEVRARGLALLGDEAERRVAPRVSRPDGGRVAPGSLENLATDIYSWMLRAHGIAPGYPELLAAWLRKPVPLKIADLETVEEWQADRSAVPLYLYRRTRSMLRDEIERCRRRDGTLDPERTFRRLRDLLLVDLTGTGARIGEIARIRPCDYIRAWDCDGRTVPAVRLRPRKTRRGRAAAWRIKAIHPETASYLEEWFAFVGLSRDDERPIWMSTFAYSGNDDGRYLVENRVPGPRMLPASLSGRLSGSKSARSIPLFPKPGEGGYSAHTVRHLVEALAFGVGSDWLKAHADEWQNRVTQQVFADAALNHRMSSDKLGYKDLERNRDGWSLRASYGDPERNVPGVLDLLIGDAGARRGWDLELIREASRKLSIAQRRFDEAERTLVARRLARRQLRQRRLPTAPANLDQLSSDETSRLHLERDLAREQLDAERDALDELIEQAHTDVDAAKATRDRARIGLDSLQARGRIKPIPDSEPTAAELDAAGSNDTALDCETWEQALARAGVAIEALMPDEDDQSPLRIRHLLNMPEFGAVLGLTDSALRKRLRGHHTPLFPLSGADSPLVTDPKHPRLRFINVDKLPAAFLKSLLPEQREMIEQLLAVPMGSTRWGGRRIALPLVP